MFQKPLNFLSFLLRNTFGFNKVYHLFLRNKIKQAISNKNQNYIYYISPAQTVTELTYQQIELIQEAISLKKEECATESFNTIDLKPISNFILTKDIILAEMFESIIEDEYESNPNAIAAYNIIYRDSVAFQNLETEVFNEMLESRELLHNK
tara:strand:- start:806 stop:1261 length:456 start_codon:yes stop_codon:yes gene_type:complete